MNKHVHAQMVNEGLDFFGGAPRFTNQTIDIGPKHGKGVVNGTVTKHLFLRLVSPTLSSLTLSKLR